MVAFARLAALISLGSASISYASSLKYARALELAKDVEPRSLKAAALNADIAKRGLHVPMRQDVQLHYFDDGTDREDRRMSARVSLSSEHPTLVLEEIEHLIEEVYCESGAIQLKFASAHFKRARATLESHPTFLIVTSHYGCNEEGSRAPYAVSKCCFSEGDSIAKLSVEPMSWKAHYDLRVDFGADDKDYQINRHSHLRRRQDAGPTAAETSLLSAVPTSSVGTVSSAITFPLPQSTPASDVRSAVGSVATSYIDTPILPLEGAFGEAVNGLSVGGLSIPEGINVSCKNCTTYGKLTLTEGTFTVNSDARARAKSIVNADVSDTVEDATDFVGDVKDFVDDGYVMLAADGLGAHIELESEFQSAELTGQSIPITLATFPLQPFNIPGIAIVGPMFTPRLVLGATLSADLKFGYGFEVTVPNNSTALASFSVNRSSITGFDQTEFNGLPFTAEADNFKLNLSVTLQPELLIGVSLFNSDNNVGAGVFLDLPQLALSVQPVSGTNDRCEPESDPAVVADTQARLGNLINLVPAVGLVAGFIAQASLGLPVVPDIEEEIVWEPLSTQFAGPTTCLAFQNNALVTATDPAGAAATSSGAASTINVPSFGFGYELRILGIVFVSLFSGMILL